MSTLIPPTAPENTRENQVTLKAKPWMGTRYVAFPSVSTNAETGAGAPGSSRFLRPDGSGLGAAPMLGWGLGRGDVPITVKVAGRPRETVSLGPINETWDTHTHTQLSNKRPENQKPHPPLGSLPSSFRKGGTSLTRRFVFYPRSDAWTGILAAPGGESTHMGREPFRTLKAESLPMCTSAFHFHTLISKRTLRTHAPRPCGVSALGHRGLGPWPQNAGPPTAGKAVSQTCSGRPARARNSDGGNGTALAGAQGKYQQALVKAGSHC